MSDRIIYTHCCRCGRKLRTAEAQELGFGPVCYKKMKNSIKRVNTDGKTIKMRRLFEIAEGNT